MGCAGTISRLIEEGVSINYVAFSKCTASVPKGFAPDTLVGEAKECLKRLGVPADKVQIEDFPVRYFHQFRQEILEILVSLRKMLNPDLVFSPSLDDLHQDHAVIAMEALRAFKHTSLLGYELVQNSRQFPTSCFFALEKQHLEAKAYALLAYESQGGRSYLQRDFLFGHAKMRGIQCNSEYAEAFEPIRMLF
jgi:LmbE family N-acetylglucosaminyl deacetylase